MEDSYLYQSPVSISNIIASSGPFQIELIKYVGTDDYVKFIEISESLVKEYGRAAKLTPNTIQTYFNREGTLPFIARHQNQIIGYIIWTILICILPLTSQSGSLQLSVYAALLIGIIGLIFLLYGFKWFEISSQSADNTVRGY